MDYQKQLYDFLRIIIIDKTIGSLGCRPTITMDDGEYCHLNDGKRFYQFRCQPGKNFASLSIREDGDTRTVFNGFIYSPHDLWTVMELTINPPEYR